MTAPALKSVCVWPILLGILIVRAAAFAQLLGQITGTVKGENGQRLPGARVVLSASESNPQVASIVTNANGQYVIVDVRYGTYTLTATLAGFKQAAARSLTLASATATVDFTLAPLLKDEDVFTSGSIPAANKRPPALSPAGIQGTTAPSGYSAASAEETSQVIDRVTGLDQDLLSQLTPGERVPECNEEADLLQAARADPEGFDPNHALGIFYLGHSDFVHSIRYLRLASEARPLDTNNSRELALAYLGAGLDNDTVALLQPMTEQKMTEPGLLRLLALAYQGSGNPQKSAAVYLRAAGLDNGEQNLFQCGIGLIDIGSADDAANLFASATVTHPASARLWMGLGIAQDLQQRKSDAIHSLLRAVEVDAGYFPSYSFLANLAGNSTATDIQIRRRLAELVVAYPDSPEAHYNYALALWRQRRLSPNAASATEIESQLRLAIAKEPKMARAHFQLGVVYADSGDYVRARNELQETVQLDPGNAEAHYRLAQAYRRDNQAELANLEIEKFQAMHGNAAGGQDDVKTAVQQLGPQPSRHFAQGKPCHNANPSSEAAP